MTSIPAAVLWDMDGTLIDTEPYWIECERELIEAHGGRWSDEDAVALIGSDLLTAAEVIRSRGGVPMRPHEIVDTLSAAVAARIRHGVPWRPGARERCFRRFLEFPRVPAARSRDPRLSR